MRTFSGVLPNILLLTAAIFVAHGGQSEPVSQHLAKQAEYQQYVGSLLTTTNFRMEYFDDGAADASVLYPYDNQGAYLPPADSVISILRLKQKSLPILIDCLGDGRFTHAIFDGNRITNRMRVPVGYVCLDILMGFAAGKPVSDPECSNDGLGACMNNGFYFRPDDYYLCSEQGCDPRPWVLVVQKNWKKMFSAGRLQFRNPYDIFPASIYQNFKTPKR